MSTLIVPDVHEQIIKLRQILECHEPSVEHVVFLGDFMDTFDGLTPATAATIQWLASNLAKPQYTFLWGNHDIHYAYPLSPLISSGYDLTKQTMLNEALSRADWDHFKLVHFHEPTGIMLSHAGLHPYWLDESIPIQDDIEAAMIAVKAGNVTRLLRAGVARGGRQSYGGLTWLDWNLEFKPISGLRQIVGHTPAKKPRTTPNGDWCLDTGLRHIAILEDNGDLIIHDA